MELNNMGAGFWEQTCPPPLIPSLSSLLGLDDKDKDKNGWAVGDGRDFLSKIFDSRL